tara:strand:+ start:89 stop:1564 length:1476 start_codon:yes stop_codon:yes gene_type:complete
MLNKKFIIITAAVFIFLAAVSLNAVFDSEEDNIPDSIEKFVPTSVKKFILDTFLSKKMADKKIEILRESIRRKDIELKSENKIVDELLDKLYETGLENLKFFKVLDEQEIISNNSNKFKITTFQTNYLSIGTWPHTKASAYLETHKDKIILVSKNGIISYFSTNELNNDEFNSKIIDNNLKQIIDYESFYKHGGKGIKDILISEEKLYITYSNQFKKNCYNTSILVANINFDFLNFEKFFVPPSCLKVRSGYNRWSNNSAGGRLIDFNNNKFLFSHGGFKTRIFSQDESSVYGKIILIDKKTKDWSIFSKGHRNVQGLYYDNLNNVILSTEHGPQGGDEINFNKIKTLQNFKIKNFGWPISSYGEHYGGKEKDLNKENYKEAPLNKSHSKFGFIEPIKYFVPSIGISEIKKIPLEFGSSFENDYFIGAMGNNILEGDLSLHHIKLNDKNNKIVYHDIIGLNERVRDIIYNGNINKFILFLENSASIAVIEN